MSTIAISGPILAIAVNTLLMGCSGCTGDGSSHDAGRDTVALGADIDHRPVDGWNGQDDRPSPAVDGVTVDQRLSVGLDGHLEQSDFGANPGSGGVQGSGGTPRLGADADLGEVRSSGGSNGTGGSGTAAANGGDSGRDGAGARGGGEVVDAPIDSGADVPNGDAPRMDGGNFDGFAMCQSVPGATASGWKIVPQLIDDFSWPLGGTTTNGGTPGYGFGRLPGSRGELGGGDSSLKHGVTIGSGVATLTASRASSGTSWSGLWFSSYNRNTDLALTIDLKNAMPWPIAQEYQAIVKKWRLRAKGTGHIKVELQGADATAGTTPLIKAWPIDLSSPDSFALLEGSLDDSNMPAGIGVKLLNLVLDAPDSSGTSTVSFDDVGFDVQVRADLGPLRYAFLVAYAQLLRAFDRASGFSRDRAQWPAGIFDSVPALGFQALGAAVAWDLGFVTLADAQVVAKKSIASLTMVPRLSGWMPHFLVQRLRDANSEWSTVDTALALISALLAADALGLSSERTEVLAIVDGLDFAAVTNPDGISHGFDAAGNRMAASWTNWGGETMMVLILRALQAAASSLPSHDQQPPAYCGVGFITELGAQFFARLGAPGVASDQWGVDWNQVRRQHLRDQKHAGLGNFYGLSAVEVISDLGETAYLAAGIGTSTCSRTDSLPGFGGTWYAPHYASMVAALDPAKATATFEILDSQGLLPPLGGPAEAVKVDTDGTLRQWHSAETSLNAFFHTIGLYHALAVAECRTDVVYGAAASDARLQDAISALLGP